MPHIGTLGWLYVVALAVTLPMWWRLTRRDPQLTWLYLAALCGALVGGKAGYLAAEGWLLPMTREALPALLAGKTITGALIGGFIAVEAAKATMGVTRHTGDFFALVVPLGIAIGRIGCVANGCCAGRGTWPAAEIELGFNVAWVIVALAMQRAGACRGQRFHLYMIAYGIFRFGHEFLRATPACCLGITGYQVQAAILVVLGGVGYLRRRASTSVEADDTRLRSDAKAGQAEVVPPEKRTEPTAITDRTASCPDLPRSV